MSEQSPEPPNEFMGQELNEEDKAIYAKHLKNLEDDKERHEGSKGSFDDDMNYTPSN